jgi:hypothetical protein
MEKESLIPGRMHALASTCNNPLLLLLVLIMLLSVLVILAAALPLPLSHLQDEEAEEWCEVQLAKQRGQNATVDLQVWLSDLHSSRHRSRHEAMCCLTLGHLLLMHHRVMMHLLIGRLCRASCDRQAGVVG